MKSEKELDLELIEDKNSRCDADDAAVQMRRLMISATIESKNEASERKDNAMLLSRKDLDDLARRADK